MDTRSVGESRSLGSVVRCEPFHAESRVVIRTFGSKSHSFSACFTTVPNGQPLGEWRQVGRRNGVSIERTTRRDDDWPAAACSTASATSRSISPGVPLTRVPRLSTPQQIAGPSHATTWAIGGPPMRSAQFRAWTGYFPNRPKSSGLPHTCKIFKPPPVAPERIFRSRREPADRKRRPRSRAYRPSRREPRSRFRQRRPPGNGGRSC